MDKTTAFNLGLVISVFLGYMISQIFFALISSIKDKNTYFIYQYALLLGVAITVFVLMCAYLVTMS